MATKMKKSSARKKAAPKRRSAARKSASRKPAMRKAAAKKSTRSAAPRRKSPVARVKSVTREVVQQATVAVAAGVETLKDLGGSLVDRVRS
jgi:hypothetical protein